VEITECKTEDVLETVPTFSSQEHLRQEKTLKHGLHYQNICDHSRNFA
jgi:hypothetical protein